MQSRLNTIAETLVSPDPSPLAKAGDAERRAILQQCERLLTGRQSLLLILRYEEDWTFLEIAVEFDVSKVAVLKMHGRIMRILLMELASRRIYRVEQIL